MKTKDLKKQIKNDLYDLTPDVISKIDFKSLVIEEKVIQEAPVRKKAFRLSYTLTSVLAFSLVLFFVLNAVTTAPLVETRKLSFETKEEIYTLSTFSSVALLYQNNQTLLTLSALGLGGASADEMLINTHIDTLNQYLNFLEPILTNSEALSFEIKASVLEGYQKQITFSSILLSEEAVTYTLYYNETKEKDTTLISGIMKFLEQEYVFTGKLIKIDGKEEFSLKAFQTNNTSNYIEVNQKLENNKQKFEYSIYEAGEEVFESEIKIELLPDNILIELNYETDLKEIDFKIVKQKSSNTIYVEYEIETDALDEEGYIVISVILDPVSKKYNYHYQIFSEDYEVEFDKDRIFDFDDDAEEDVEEDDDNTEEEED